MKKIHKRNVAWLQNPSFLELYQTSVLPDIHVTSVFCFIVNDNNEILFIKNIKPNRSWEIPGGHVENGESPIEALHRECLEEGMVSINEPLLFAIHKVTNLEKNSKYPPRSCQAFYVAKLKETHPFISNAEIGERKFIDIQKLNEIDWCSEYKDLVELSIKALKELK